MTRPPLPFLAAMAFAFALPRLAGAAPHCERPVQPTLLFEDGFHQPGAIADTAAAGGPDARWYRTPFFTRNPPLGELAVTDRGVQLKDGQIATAVPTANGGWQGKVFGGRLYIEARLSFEPAGPGPRKAWPAFWGMAIEHAANLPSVQWPGQAAGYQHYIEDDFFENDTDFRGPDTYGGAIHDWSGIWRQTCPSGFCNFTNTPQTGQADFVIAAPPATDWREMHTFGQLISPSDRRSSQGYARYYFDDARTTDVVRWPRYSDAVPPGADAGRFSIIEKQNLYLILSTGAQPMTVAWVKVWRC